MKRKSIIICVIIFAFLFFVVGFLFWRGRLAMNIDAKLQAIRAAGLPTSGKELNAYYPVVPDNENAALVMTQAFALMRNFSDSRSNDIAHFKILSRGQHLTKKQKQIFADYIKMNSVALAKMREAIKLPKSRYSVDYTPGPNTDISHLRKLHNLAEVVRYKSLFASESDDTTNAVAAIENLLGMAHTLDEEPDIIAQLVRIGFIAMAKNSLEHCLNVTNLNELELADLASTFSSTEKTNLMARALAGDCADHIWVFIRVNRRANAAKEFVEGAQQVGGFSTPTLDRWLIRDPRFFQIIGFWDRDFLYYLNVMEANISLVNFAPPLNLIAAENFKNAEEKAKKKHYYLSNLLLPVPMVIIKEAKAFAYLRTTTTAIAIERFRLAHGRLPENLDELVPQFLPAVPPDPFDGKPLHYHRLTKGYVIYSIGADGHDDGGKEKPADWKSGDKTNYDITFIVER